MTHVFSVLSLWSHVFSFVHDQVQKNLLLRLVGTPWELAVVRLGVALDQVQRISGMDRGQVRGIDM